MIQTLKMDGGKHMLVSPIFLGKELKLASEAEIHNEKEKMMAACFILGSNKSRYKNFLDNLKRSANLGRDEYPETLTGAFNL